MPPAASRSSDSVSDYIRRNRVFILGAGFSAGAGVPLTADLVGRALGRWKEEAPGSFRLLRGYIDATFGTEDIDFAKVNFSDFCTFVEYIELREHAGGERFSIRGSSEKLALRYFLARVIVENTPPAALVPDLYLQFARQLQPGDVVITFNWDCLLESALDANGEDYTYNFEDKRIKLCKLHGSVHWRLGLPERQKVILDWRPIGFANPPLVPEEVYYAHDVRSSNMWYDFPLFSELEPFLVLPGYGKAFDIRSIATLWYKPEFAFGTTHDIYIIGLGLAPDDFFVRSFFLDNLPYVESYSGVPGRRIFVINPDPAARDAYRFVLKHGHAELIEQQFGPNHIDLMRNRLLV
jgi:hypothetical protein